MKEIILTSRQQMLSPDQLSFEMGLIPTPEKMEMNRKVTYILIGSAVTIAANSITFLFAYTHFNIRFGVQLL